MKLMNTYIHSNVFITEHAKCIYYMSFNFVLKVLFQYGE